MLSLSMVVIASILASVALFFLMRSSLAEDKKQTILVLVGILFFLSIAISNFKSREFTLPFFSSPLKSKLKSIYLKDQHPYAHKYDLDPSNVGDALLHKNYGEVSKKKQYIEAVVYSSDKDEGASYFLYSLSEKLRGKGVPTLYVKFQSLTSSSKQFLRKTGLPSFQGFRDSLTHYLDEGTRPYIILDNVQLTPYQVLDILQAFEPSNSPHMIFNTENIHSFIELISDSQDFVRRFQFQQWQGPDQQLLQNISPTNSYVKKVPINFETINALKQGSSEEQILLRGANSQKNVASYFGLTRYYDKIRRLLEKGKVTMGVLQQQEIPIEMIERLQRLRLVGFKDGELILK